MRKKNPFDIHANFIKDSYLRRVVDLDWIEKDSLKNKQAEGQHPGKSEASVFLGLSLNYKRLNRFLVFFLLGLLVLFLKTSYLQIIKGDYYYNLAEGNRIRIRDIKAERGVIYDKKGNILVQNIPNFYLTIIPGDLPRSEEKKEEVVNQLAVIISLEQKDIWEKLEKFSNSSYSPIIIKENIDFEEAIKLEIKSADLPGVVLLADNRREYLTGLESFSHILGYEGRITEKELEKYEEYSLTDRRGKTGLELFYENELRGLNGKAQVEVDALGKEIKTIAWESPTAGYNLVLALDLELQKKLETIFKKHLAKNYNSKGVVIAMDPRNGEILALVSLPGFDNNLFAKGISTEDYNNLLNDKDQPLFFRGIVGEYPSGSTFKPVVAVAALEEGIINRNTSVFSVGGIRIGEWFFPDWRAGGHGSVNVIKALANSVNTFFYYIGGGYEDFRGLGVTKIVEYAKLFGLGEVLGIDLPGEASGFLPSKKWKEETKNESWYIGDTYHLAIGQGDILVTPLQVASFTSVFANGGTLYKPHLVKEILDAENNLIKKIESEVIRKDFLARGNIEIVREGLREAVTSGSAWGMSTLNVTSAGKTGTAQWSSDKETHAWFTSFAPFEEPEIVVTILIEEGGEGSSIALPVAREFLEEYFK